MLTLLTERMVVVSLALVGAALSVAGSLGRPAARGAAAACAVRVGYGLTGLSVVLFILAGFLNAR